VDPEPGAANGFTADSTRELVKKWGVFLLLSPPHCPSYNGSIEAGICSLQAEACEAAGAAPNMARTDHHAARNGRPGEWSCEDIEAARLEANETARPWGSKGPLPDEVWRSRTPITEEERDALRWAVTKFSRWWRKLVARLSGSAWRIVPYLVGSKPKEEVRLFRGYSGDSYHQLPRLRRFLPFGQPPLRGTSLLPVRFSSPRTKPSSPRGRPVRQEPLMVTVPGIARNSPGGRARGLGLRFQAALAGK